MHGSFRPEESMTGAGMLRSEEAETREGEERSSREDACQEEAWNTTESEGHRGGEEMTIGRSQEAETLRPEWREEE
eukprot:436335-Hanusia_phi.AAC.1